MSPAGSRSVHRHILARYGGAAVLVAAALVMTWALSPVMGKNQFLFFTTAVVISAFFGGLGPGLFATVISVTLILSLVIPPVISEIITFDDALRLGLFSAVGLVMSVLGGAKRRADRRLRNNEERFRLIFESIQDYAIFIVDPDNRVTSWNRGAERVLGYSEHEAIGMPASVFFTPEDRRANAPEQELGLALSQGRAGDDRWHMRKDGSRFWATGMVRPLKDDEGRLIGFTKVMRDITERKKSQEELEARAQQQAVVAQLGQLALGRVDLQRLMDEAVNRVAEALGIKYAEVLELWPNGRELLLRAGVGWRDGLVGRATVKADLQSQAGFTLKALEPVIVDDLRTETRFNGPSLLLEHGVVSGISVVIGGHHRPYGVLGVHTARRRTFTRDDVYFLQSIANILAAAIERKRADDEIRAFNDELEGMVAARTAELTASNRELEAFSYSISHDLRTPLRAIDGFSQALLEEAHDKLTDRERDYFHRIRAASQKMGQLIDDLLNLSRTARREMRQEPVDLSAQARLMSEALQEQTPERKAEIFVQPGLVVRGDSQLLQSALQNLLSNAWKFTANKDVTRIEFGAMERDGDTIYFVRDNGAGFDMAYAGKLFGAFQRLHDAHEFPGTGIGLATVQRIVHRHGGRIWAEGEPGKGAAFYFTLPQHRRADAMPDGSSRSLSGAESTPA
jgi:PAS domain S-box-containing protein